MKHLILGSLLACTSLVNAQTFGNMPFTTQQISNPSFTALNELPTLNVHGKVGRLFNSSYIGYNQYSKKLKGTWGVYYNGFNAKVSDVWKVNRSRLGFSYARLFEINDNWRYSLGAGIDMSRGGYHYSGETILDFDLGINVGGTLYGKNLFTALNFGYSIDGRSRFEWKTGYKLTPLKNTDFSITPILTINSLGGRLYTEANVNFGYKKLSLNLGYNYDGVNAGFAYDFNRFKVNYSVGNMFSLNSKQYFHEAGIQYKLGKKRQAKRDTKFNHRLF